MSTQVAPDSILSQGRSGRFSSPGSIYALLQTATAGKTRASLRSQVKLHDLVSQDHALARALGRLDTNPAPQELRPAGRHLGEDPGGITVCSLEREDVLVAVSECRLDRHFYAAASGSSAAGSGSPQLEQTLAICGRLRPVSG